MEDEVASFVGNLVLNIMYTPLFYNVSMGGPGYPSILSCNSPPLMVLNVLQKVLKDQYVSF